MTGDLPEVGFHCELRKGLVLLPLKVIANGGSIGKA
jgi:hypothetical protein